MAQLMFKGLKVLDCSSFIAAPAAATILSDFGADVIKIEPPGAGDPYRAVPSLPTMPQAKENYAWMLASRNKRGLALNLAKPSAQQVVRRLVVQADVFITNFPAVVRKKLGLRYEDLAPLNDRLIYASFTGYGEYGEEASKPGFDITAWWARSGLMDGVRTEATAPPARSLTGMGDHPSGISLYAGIVMGLYQRQLTGMGAHVGTSLLANGVWCNGVMAQAALCGARFIDRPPRERALNAFTNYYQCRDKRWLILTILNEERQWPVFIKCLGRDDLQNDRQFATSRDRMKNAVELTTVLDKTFATKDRSEWREILAAGGIVFDVVASAQDIPNDSQILANDILVPFDNDGVLTVTSPICVEGQNKVKPRRPPAVGQHSDEVLREAGYDAAMIEQLRADGAVA
ncbi:CaiB/BaiF CoA transferase family protein [Bradyrhizobium sp. AZCC 2289]|uniref:CaiB/BaiF CoA transferase family protein n=1 Tax=Bradyrhizobium sp. AZCC 2289 TaxID=3117026 RepID=UPI002FEEE09F